MVQRIVDAGHHVLLTHGYDGASTNRIADRAGISPGSLYQYFANKDAIIAAVITQYADGMEARVAAAATLQLDQPAPVLVRTAIEALLDALAEQPEFLRVVVEQTPRIDGGDRLEKLEQRVAEIAAAYLRINRRLVRAAPPEPAAWILVQTVEQLTIRYVLDRPPISRDVFIDELATLTLNYLRPD
jgi:AcrR family transcriptional regulator